MPAIFNRTALIAFFLSTVPLSSKSPPESGRIWEVADTQKDEFAMGENALMGSIRLGMSRQAFEMLIGERPFAVHGYGTEHCFYQSGYKATFCDQVLSSFSTPRVEQ